MSLYSSPACIRGLLAVVLAMTMATGSVAQDKIGEREFVTNCGVCHGADGRGNSPMLDLLKNVPADLTQISARNDGRFPIQEVYDTIADTDRVRAHGTSEMPIWGDRFNLEKIAVEGEMGMGTSSIPPARARILELVFFLATIQEPS